MRMQETLSITYPCYLIAHGPERTHRTTFRGEHGGYFASGFVMDLNEAVGFIDRAGKGYPGHYHEMQIIVVWRDTNELNETTL